MGVTNLVAYIPVLNQRHLDWFAKYPGANLHLIPQDLAVMLDPRQSRNIGALSTLSMVRCIESLGVVKNVWMLDDSCMIRKGSHLILPDDSICRAYAEGELKGVATYEFEIIWARYDMSAVKRQSPIMDVPVTYDDEHQLHMSYCKATSKRTPDWWRQIGAGLVVGGDLRITACNGHFPTDYVTDIMSDPRLMVDAGQVGKYVSFHAEKTVIAKAAQQGICTQGATLYTTVFPCEDCARAIVVAGIKHLFFEEGYSALDALEVLQSADVQITQVQKAPESV